MNYKSLAVVIIFFAVSFAGYSFWQYRIEAAGTIYTNTDSSRPDFQADLVNTLDLQKGIGVPTFTRADGADGRATVTDFEGLVRPVKNGEARFVGARRVENIQPCSENFTAACALVINNATVLGDITVAPDGKQRADQLIEDISGNEHRVVTTFTSPQSQAGSSYIASVYVKANGRIRFALREGSVSGAYIVVDLSSASVITQAAGASNAFMENAGNGWYRVGYMFTAPTANNIYLEHIALFSNATSYNNTYSGDGVSGLYLWGVQVEEVTGQTNQNPSEYVSTGVKTTAPYHGANVDGVKYFNTQNGNTIFGTTLTETTGAVIPDATLQGYLAEGTRQNKLLYSEQNENASWNDTTNVGVVPDSIIAPSGAVIADKISETVGTSYHYRGQPITLTNSTVYTYSIFVKKGTRPYIAIGFYNPSGDLDKSAWFNLDTGAFETVNSGLTTGPVVSFPNGWYRVSLSFTSHASATLYYMRVFLSPADGVINYAGDVSQNTYVWGTQLEAGAFASSYIPTISTAVTRAADVLQYPTANNFSDASGTLYLEMRTLGTGYVNAPIIGSNINAVSQFHPSAISAWDGTDTSSIPMTMNDGSSKRVSVNWSGSNKKLIANNTSSATSYDGSWGIPSLKILNTTTGSETQKIFGTIKNIKIWQKAMSDAFLQKITSASDAVSRLAVKEMNIRPGTRTTQINVNQNNKMTNGLIGFWSFNGSDISGVTAYDRSGQGNNGTLTNSPKVTEGKVGQGLYFDGVDDYIDTPDDGAANGTGVFHFNDTDEFSLSLWYKGTDTGVGDAGKTLLGRDVGDLFASFSLRNGKALFAHYNAVWQYNIISANSVADNVWHLITYINHANETGDLYVDGVAQVTGSSSTIDSNFPTYRFVISTLMRGFNGSYTSGTIDEVRIYNRALSAAEVNQLYNLGR